MIVRPRRWRGTAALRALVHETHLLPSQLVAPLFVTEEVADGPISIHSMPGVSRWPLPALESQARRLADAGVGGILLFGIPADKDPLGSAAWAPDGIVQRAIPLVRRAAPDLAILTDVCLCEYTDIGHCGLVNGHGVENPAHPQGAILDEPSVELLGRIAVSHAAAGADVVAPSAMLDGMVHGIRKALDDAGWSGVPILSYSAKFASVFYGPFREAAGGAPAFGDRRSHQLDPANVREALREHAIDVAEGADGLMVKPALAYLDVISATRARFADLPIAAYNVSGEYALVKTAAAAGWLDERRAVLEILTGIRRAGADLIITYHALDAARWLREPSDTNA